MAPPLGWFATLPVADRMHERKLRGALIVVVAAAFVVAGCGAREPIVDNQTDGVLYVRVGGAIGDGAKEVRMIEVPAQTRTSLTEARGLPLLGLMDVTVLTMDCQKLGHWPIDVVPFHGAIVIKPGRQTERRDDEAGPAGAPGEVSDVCPAGPDPLP